MTKTKKVISLIISMVSISLLIGSFSYAWLQGRLFSANQVTINAGYLDLTYQASNNLLDMTNALPQLDDDAIANNTAHTFTLTNNSTEDVGYIVKLENICVTSVAIDVCVPNQYVKAAINVDGGAYTTIPLSNGDILATGTIAKRSGSATVKTFNLKIWLASDTPNTYNKGTNSSLNIVYQGRLSLEATQQLGTLVTAIDTNLSYESIAIGGACQASVSITPSGASNKNVIWSSSNSSVASINNSGLVTGVAAGTTRICGVATDGSGIYDCVNLTVTTN